MAGLARRFEINTHQQIDLWLVTLLLRLLLCSLTPQEFAAGHVKGAFNLDSTAFATPEVVDKLIAQLEAKSQVCVWWLGWVRGVVGGKGACECSEPCLGSGSEQV